MEEAEECSLALNLGRKRSRCVENKQLCARAHTCTHTHAHVYTRGLSSPPPDSRWCRALWAWSPSTPHNTHPAATLRAPASLRPSSRVTARCWVDRGLLVTALYFIPPLKWVELTVQGFSGRGPGDSASSVNGPLVSSLAGRMLFEATLIQGVLGHRPQVTSTWAFPSLVLSSFL